jgi:hypothetical protein
MYHVHNGLTLLHTSAPATPLPEDNEEFKFCIFKHWVTGDVKTLGDINYQQAYIAFSLARKLLSQYSDLATDRPTKEPWFNSLHSPAYFLQSAQTCSAAHLPSYTRGFRAFYQGVKHAT